MTGVESAVDQRRQRAIARVVTRCSLDVDDRRDTATRDDDPRRDTAQCRGAQSLMRSAQYSGSRPSYETASGYTALPSTT